MKHNGVLVKWLAIVWHSNKMMYSWQNGYKLQEKDVDWHAISGYTSILNGRAVSWSAKRQEIVSLSMTESEYVAVTHAAKEALWLWSLLSQIFDITPKPTTLFSGNQSAIALTKDHQYHARTKHIDFHFHFIRYVVENGHLHLIYCPTNNMVADTLTKALPSAKVKHFASELGLAIVWGGVLECQTIMSHFASAPLCFIFQITLSISGITFPFVSMSSHYRSPSSPCFT